MIGPPTQETLAERAARLSQQGETLAQRAARLDGSGTDYDVHYAKPGVGTKALGTLAALMRFIPGGTAAQAGARAVTRGQSYGDALADIKGAEQAAPAAATLPASIVGAIPAGLLMPGGAVLSGARYGVASGLLAPEGDLKSRIHGAAIQGTVGAIAGKAGELATTGVRSLLSPSLGKAAMTRKAAMEATDAANYGKATAEGLMPGASPPAVAQAFAETDIAPYVAAVRGSRKFASANDATVLREAYKLMSERQGLLSTRVINANDFKAGTTLEKADVGLAKQQLMAAADQIMPSFRPATEAHAAMAGERDAFRTGADVARRAINGTTANAKKLETLSPEAFEKMIAKMTPAEAKAATEGLLSRTGSMAGLSANPISLFGIPRTVGKFGSVASLLRALDKQSGKQLPSLFRNVLVTPSVGLLSP